MSGRNIDWSRIKDGFQFQELCNDLLQEEVSYKVRPFASGEKATDAYFEGSYKGDKGIWVFESKFFIPTRTTNAPGLQRLKVELLGIKGKKSHFQKISEKYKKVDQLIILTNLKTTQKFEDAIIKGLKRYPHIKKIHFWGNEKLRPLIISNPFINYHYFGMIEPLFWPYQRKYYRELTDKRYILRFEEDKFIPRETEQKLFEDFVKDREQQILMFYGPGGVGKTHLLIKFAKIIEQKHKTYIPRFIYEQAETFEEHLQELDPQKSYLLFLDDGHKFAHLEKLSHFLRNFKKAKLVITTRTVFKDIILRTMPTYEASLIRSYELKTLDPKQIQALIKREIKDNYIIEKLTRFCKRFPILVVLLALRLFRERQSIDFTSLTDNQFLANIFEKYLSELEKVLGESAKKILSIISVLEPINIKDEKVTKEIKNFLQIGDADFAQAIRNLGGSTFIQIRRSSIKISPDILGDYILKRQCFNLKGERTPYVDDVIKKFVELAPQQVISNLAQVEYGETSLLDDVIADLEGKLRIIPPQGQWNIGRINGLKIVDKFAFFRPRDALDIITFMVDNPKADDQIEDEVWGKWTITNDMVLHDIPPIIQKIAYNIDFYGESTEILKRLSLHQSDYVNKNAREKLLDIVKLEYRRSMEYQREALKKIRQWFKEKNNELTLLCFNLLENYFVTSITYTRSDPANPRVFVWSSYPLLMCFKKEAIMSLRKESFSLLFHEIEKGNFEQKVTGINVISGAIHNLLYQNVTGKLIEDKWLYPKEQEIKDILSFLEKISVREKDYRVANAVKGCCKNFRFQRKDQKIFKRTVDRITKNIESSDEYLLYEDLVGVHRDWNISQKKDYWRNLVDKYTKRKPQYLCDLLSKMIDMRPGWIFGSVKTFMHEIGIHKKDYGVKLFSHIVKIKPSILSYAGYLLMAIREKSPQIGNKFTKILKKGNLEKKLIVIDSYDPFFASQAEEKDLNVIEEIAKTKENSLRHRIAEILMPVRQINYFSVDKNKVLKILDIICDRPDYLIAGAVAEVITLRDANLDKEEDIKFMQNILWRFIDIEKLDRGQIEGYNLEQLMRKIFVNDPMEIICFFEKRIELKNTTQVENDEFDAVPFDLGEVFATLDNLEKNVRLRLFRRVRGWTKKKGWFHIEAPRFYKLLCAHSVRDALHTEINQDAMEILLEWINDDGAKEPTRHEQILKAGFLLREFEGTNLFYEVIRQLYLKAFEYSGEKRKDILSELYAAMHTGAYTEDSKQRNIIDNLTQIRKNLPSQIKIEIDKEIKRQQEELKEHKERWEEL